MGDERHVRRLREALRDWPGARGRWGLWNAIRKADPERDWYDHGGWSAIAGRRVLIGEPYCPDDSAYLLAAARRIEAFFGAPVAFARRGHHSHRVLRFVLFFGLDTATVPGGE